jgi:hypothetical protein
MPASPIGRRVTAAGLFTASAGVALFVWLVWRVGPTQIWDGFRQIGWGLVLIVLLGGLRFAARAAAWSLTVEPPHRLPFLEAFNAVVCGDTLGNVMPLGPIISEPAKVACVRGRVPLGPALTALAIENVLYTLSVAAMIAAGTIALLFAFDVPARLREVSELALAAVVALFAVALWMLWRRPAIISRSLPWLARGAGARRVDSKLDRLRALEHEIYTFAARRRAVVAPLVGAELAFHALGVAEMHATLWMIQGAPPPLLTSFVLEAAYRLITVAFKFVPFQVGVGEGGLALVTQILTLGTSPGVTLSLVRKVRMVIWSLAGTVLLVRRGLSTRRILEDPQLNPKGV